MSHTPERPDRFVREAERRRITGLSKTTWWRMEQKNLCPKRRRLSEGAVGWLESELRAWIAERAGQEAA